MNIKLSESAKIFIIDNIWKPDSGHVFTPNNDGRLPRLKHMYKYPSWLMYSEILKGYLCLSCALFPPNEGSINYRSDTGYFVRKGFDLSHKSTEKLANHNSAQYHKFTAEQLKSLMDTNRNKSHSIGMIAKKNMCKMIQENRQLIIPIIECIYLCMRQNIALRGHKDSGSGQKIIDNGFNMGNFKYFSFVSEIYLFKF